MLRRIDLRGRTPGTIEIRGLLPRAPVQVESALESVAPICDDVRARGALAVREITKRFDGVDLATLRVPAQVLAAALADLDDSVRAALVEAARRARLVHEAQLRADVEIEVAPGGRVRERWVPVRRVGLYVPGGLVAVSEQRGDERRAGAGRRGRIARGGFPAAEGFRRIAASGGACRVRPAWRRRGLRGRRGAGDCLVCVRQHRRSRGSHRAGRRRDRSWQRVRRCSQAPRQRRRRHRLRGRSHRDRHPRR